FVGGPHDSADARCKRTPAPVARGTRVRTLDRAGHLDPRGTHVLPRTPGDGAMTIAAGLLLGLLSSLHCVTMCGPLVLMLGTPSTARTIAGRVGHIAWYHTGRITIYAALGLIAGLAGSLFALAGAGRVLAIAAGTLLIVASMTPAVATRWRFGLGPWLRVVSRAGAAARRW